MEESYFNEPKSISVRESKLLEYKILRAIERLRNSHPDIRNLYRYGQCYNFALFLCTLMDGSAIICYSDKTGHVWVKWRGAWWDIDGRNTTAPEDIWELKDDGHAPFLWGSGDVRRLLSPNEEHPLNHGKGCPESIE